MKTNNSVSEVWAQELPTSTGSSKATVDYKLFVALSDRKPSGFSFEGQYGSAWRLYDEAGLIFAKGCNAMKPELGDHTKGFIPL